MPRAPLAYTPEPKTKAELRAEARAAAKRTGAKAAPEKKPKSEPISSPALGGTFPNLDKLLDAVVEKAIEPRRKFKERKPPPWAATPEPMPWADEMPAPAADEPPARPAGGHLLNARSDPKFDARRRAKGAAVNARENSTGETPQWSKETETEGAIPEPDEQPEKKQ